MMPIGATARGLTVSGAASAGDRGECGTVVTSDGNERDEKATGVSTGGARGFSHVSTCGYLGRAGGGGRLGAAPEWICRRTLARLRMPLSAHPPPPGYLRL